MLGAIKVRKKPVTVEAMRYTGDNSAEVIVWAHQGLHPLNNAIVTLSHSGLRIRTLEDKDGVAAHYASPGDWIIRGVQGEFYPCKPDIFEATYDRLDAAKERE